jgi:hypothetical protein
MGTVELQIDSSTMTLNNGGYATSDDIEMQTPPSEMQFFYEEKDASVAASPRPSLSIVEPSAAPKYSAKWWRKTWDKMVARRRWRRIIYGTVFFALLMGWVGVMIGFMASENRYGMWLEISSNDAKIITHYQSAPFQSRRLQSDTYIPLLMILQLNRYVLISFGRLFTYFMQYLLKGNLVKFDPDSRTLSAFSR